MFCNTDDRKLILSAPRPMSCHKAEVSCTIRGSHDGLGQDAAMKGSLCSAQSRAE